jgi:hypothetical protein
MKIYGELEEVSLEQLSTDPVANTQGRIYQNTTKEKVIVDDGVAKKALLRNDDKMTLGNDATDANNARIHKAGNETIQLARGDDATAEGADATDLGQFGARIENVLDASLPANGNEGRLNYVTDQKVFGLDDGAAWRKLVPEYSNDDATTGTTVELASITSSVVRLTGSFATLAEIPAGFPSQRVTLINRTGADVSISNDSGTTDAHRILTGTSANIVFKEDSAMNFYYDSVTERWNVVGEAAGSALGGGNVPSSSVVVATANYSVLITDDIILADASGGTIQLTLPTAAGNIGKRLTFQKIDANPRLVVEILGTINGIVDYEIRETDAPLEIISDGTVWKTISAPSGEVFFTRPIDPRGGSVNDGGPQSLAAMSLAQVDLETLAEGVNIDNVIVKVGNKVLLKDQDATEEYGIYEVPFSPITIAASSIANEDISTIQDGSVINVTVVSTGQLISLRFQTDPQENGIYVVGATPGTTERDTSLRDSNYTDIEDFQDLLVYPDYYTHTFLNTTAPTAAGGTIANDRKIFRQTAEVITNFSDLVFSDALEVITVKVPSHARTAVFDVCPFGGSGGSARNNSYGGSGGGGALPVTRRQKVTPGGVINITLPLGARPGTSLPPAANERGQVGPSILINGYTDGQEDWVIPVLGGGGVPPIFSWTFPGGNDGETITRTTAANAYVKGGAEYTGGGRYQRGGESVLTASGGAPSSVGGIRAGGGGGAGSGPGGHGGSGFSGTNVFGYWGQNAPGYGGGGGGGGGGGSSQGRAGRGGFGGPGYVRITWE